MKKILFAIIVVLAAFNASADSLFIEDFSIEAGETKQVGINLNNSGDLVALQFEMYLPNGLSVAKDSRGRLRCSVNGNRADDHTLTMGDRGNGQYNAAYYSANNYEIMGNSGEIISVYVTAADDFSGTATIELKEIYVSDAAGNMPHLSNTSCTVTGPQPVNPPVGAASMFINDFSIEAGETKQVSVNLNNESDLVAFQLEMHLPNGLVVAKDSRNRLRCAVNADRADGHTITMGDRGNGQYNVAYYSTNNYEIVGNSGEVFNLWVTAADDFKGTATVQLREVYVSDAVGTMTKLEDSSCTVTGPQPVNPPASDDSMFINDFEIAAGETKQVGINLNNSDELVAFQLELHLPAGLTVATDDRGRLRCSVNSERADDHTLTMGDRGNGQYNAAYYSANNYEIVGNSGEIISVWITADNDFHGTATIELKEIYVSNAAGTMTQLGNTTCTVTSGAPEPQEDKATSIALDMSEFKTTETALVQVYPTIEPAAAASQEIAWKSSNEEIATVDTHGRIKALKPGKVTITATTTDGSNLGASCEVTILMKGDMNEDLTIDVTDINSIIKIILKGK